MVQICSNDYVMMEKEWIRGYNRVIEDSKERDYSKVITEEKDIGIT